MYGKEKIAFIVFIFTALISCKSAKINRSAEVEEKNIKTEYLGEIRNRNLFDGPTSIDKISVLFDDGKATRRFRAYLRYNGRDSMLVSIRTIAGIEAARILLSQEKVEVIDRINDIFYTGKTKELGRRYGFENMEPGILFGDFTGLVNIDENIKCVNGIAEIADGGRNRIIGYKIDCELKKVNEIRIYKRNDGELIKGEFSEITQSDSLSYPGVIKWDLSGNMRIELKVAKAKRRERVIINFRKQDNYTKKVIR
ncbi:MAG: DUF4292 domain-containing protein [Bacteroidales bacterium]|nr:DUF4292 domain-containing protein [Bacteroidales bacterium]